ncbi:extracellular solute-binding protein [Cohnella nanjingensis]|uniref:Extracellular solute-binding protein n=2 Tax=Cohnella nanjingensis TaxID=1387779 RepID=A0A7X0VFN9_9BACL|nr:extracellular solute-binding protein [Cohnella nanjingensis]
MQSKHSKKTSLIFSTLLVVVIVAALAGCSPKSASPGDSANAPETKETASPTETSASSGSNAAPADDTKEFVTLTWYMTAPLDPRPNEEKVMKDLNDRLKEKINANVVFKFVDGATYAQKMKVAAAAGEQFDIFLDLNQLGFSQIVSSGMALEVDDLLNKYGQDILKKVPDQAWQAVTARGKKFGISNPSAWVSSYNISLRKDIVDKYSIDYQNIHTYDQLEPVLKMLKEKEPNLIPFMGDFVSALPNTMDKISPMIGYDNLDGQWKSLLDNPEWVKIQKLQHDWYLKGYISKKLVTDYAEFKTGKYAGSIYHIYDASFAKVSTDLGTPMVSTPLDFTNYVTGSTIRSAVNYISKTSKHPERAMMLLNLLFKDKDLFNRFCYGLEGDDWNYVSGKGTDNPTIKTKDKLEWAIWHPFIGSLWDQWPSNWNSQEVLDGLKAAIDKAKYSPYVGFTFDSSPVKKEMAQIDALEPELKTIYMAKDLDAKMAEYKEKAKKAGLDNVIAEIQKQVDAWKTADGK